MRIGAGAAALILLNLGPCAWAEEGAPGTSPSAPSAVQPAQAARAESPAQPPVVKKKSARPGAKGKRPREKDAEGSEAADRFEADTVIKSKYRLNGEPLEVDPD
jgi:hypothetical protein